MTAAAIGPLEDLAALLNYPRADFRARLEAARAGLGLAAPEAGAALEAFAAEVAGKSETELEELYTQTFDMNPSCALELGWHLYGEDYQRGAFLILMRGHMRRLGLEEDRELTDHLSHVLAVVGRMEEDEARGFATEKIIPVLGKMRKAIPGNPYDHALRAIEILLGDRFAVPAGGNQK